MFNKRIKRFIHSYNLRKKRKIDYGESSGTEYNEDDLNNKVPYTRNFMNARYTRYNNIIKFCKRHKKSKQTNQIQYKIKRKSSLTKIHERKRFIKIKNGKHLFRVAKNMEKSKNAFNIHKKFLNYCRINGYIKESINSYNKLYEFSNDLFPIELINKHFYNDFNKMIGVKKTIDENLQYFIVSENFIKQSIRPWISFTIEMLNTIKEVLKIKETIDAAEITYEKNIDKINSLRLIILMDLFVLIEKKIDINILIKFVNYLYLELVKYYISRGPALYTVTANNHRFYIFFDVAVFVDKENTKSTFYVRSTRVCDNKDNINVPKHLKAKKISNDVISIKIEKDSYEVFKEYSSNNNNNKNKTATKRNAENEKETDYFEKKKLKEEFDEDLIFSDKEDEISDLSDCSDDDAWVYEEFDEIVKVIYKNLENSEKEEEAKSIKDNVQGNIPLPSGNKITAELNDFSKTTNDNDTNNNQLAILPKLSDEDNCKQQNFNDKMDKTSQSIEIKKDTENLENLMPVMQQKFGTKEVELCIISESAEKQKISEESAQNIIKATITSNDDNTKSQLDIALDCAENQKNELLNNNRNDINKIDEETIDLSKLEQITSKSITQVKRKELTSSQDINIQNNSKVIDNLTKIQQKKAVKSKKFYEHKKKNLSNILLNTEKSTKPVRSNLENIIYKKSLISYPVKKDTVLKKKCSEKATNYRTSNFRKFCYARKIPNVKIINREIVGSLCHLRNRDPHEVAARLRAENLLNNQLCAIDSNKINRDDKLNGKPNANSVTDLIPTANINTNTKINDSKNQKTSTDESEYENITQSNNNNNINQTIIMNKPIVTKLNTRTCSKSEVRHLVNKGKINLIENHNKFIGMCEILKSSENHFIQPDQNLLSEKTKETIPVKEIVKSTINSNIEQNSDEISKNEYTPDIELTEEQIQNPKVLEKKSTQNPQKSFANAGEKRCYHKKSDKIPISLCLSQYCSICNRYYSNEIASKNICSTLQSHSNNNSDLNQKINSFHYDTEKQSNNERINNQRTENILCPPSEISHASIPITTEINSKYMNFRNNYNDQIPEKLPTLTNIINGSNAQQNPDLKSSENPNTILTNKSQSIKNTSSENFFSLNTSYTWSTNSNTVQVQQSLPTNQALKTNYTTNTTNQHAPFENETKTNIESALRNRSLNTQACITQEPKIVVHNNFHATNILFGKLPSQQNVQFIQGNESSRIPFQSLKIPTNNNKNTLECTNQESMYGNLQNPTSSYVDQSNLNSKTFSGITINSNSKNYLSTSTNNVFTHEFSVSEQININHSRLGIPQCIDSTNTEHIRSSANREIEDQFKKSFAQSKTNETIITNTYENLENHQRDIKSSEESQESEHHPLFRNFFTNASQNPSSFQNQESREINAVFNPYMDMHKETYYWKNSVISNTFRNNHEATHLNHPGNAQNNYFQNDVSSKTGLVFNSYSNNMHNNQEDIRNYEQSVICPNPQYARNGMTNNEGQPLFYRTQNCPSATFLSHALENRVSEIPFHYQNINPEIHRIESMTSTDSNNMKQELIVNKPKRTYRRVMPYKKKQPAKSNEKQINMLPETTHNESVLENGNQSLQMASHLSKINIISSITLKEANQSPFGIDQQLFPSTFKTLMNKSNQQSRCLSSPYTDPCSESIDLTVKKSNQK